MGYFFNFKGEKNKSNDWQVFTVFEAGFCVFRSVSHRLEAKSVKTHGGQEQKIDGPLADGVEKVMPENVPPDNTGPDAPGGAVSPPTATDPGSAPGPQDSRGAVAAAPPAAAVTVLNGRTERELELERELGDAQRVLARTAAEKKDRETRIMELEDELKRLRAIPAEPKRPWFDPFNILNDE